MYLTVKEAAKRLKLSVPSVRKALASGELRGLRVGRLWRVVL